MLIRNHEVFGQVSSRQTIWRYMDFTKLVSLLEDRSLVFPRTDQFEDPYEGYLPEAAVREIRANKGALGFSDEHANLWIKFPETMRKQLYVSCWFASEHESAAMWKLYISSSEGIAIKTNTDSLAAVLNASTLTIGMSAVRYIDYEKTSIPFGNALFPVIHKRMSFAHENEIRAVIWSELTDNRPQIETQAMCVHVPVDPSVLIEAVHVSPAAPAWFGALVEKVVGRYQLHLPVVRSGLYSRPVY